MVYRNYFCIVEKSEVSKVRDMNYGQLCDYAKQCGVVYDEDGEQYFNFLDEKFMNKRRIFDFGKLRQDDIIEMVHNVGTPLFEEQEVRMIFDEPYEPYITGKAGLEAAIDVYKNKVVEGIKSLVKADADDTDSLLRQVQPDNLDLQAVCNAIMDKLVEWGRYIPYDLDENTDEISSSRNYEYQVFELVRLYKTIDWSKYVLLFMGWRFMGW